MKLRSLHARLVAGAVFWTLGLFVAATMLAIAIMLHWPRTALAVHNGLLAFLGAILVTAGFLVIRKGLSPLTVLRDRLSQVREGRVGRLDGEYPTEVSPLVADLNDLLADRERRVARAMTRAGDLAHGLKTPLAVLAHDARRAAGAGHAELAASISQQVERMRRQIDWHLAEARAMAGAAAPSRTSVEPALRGLVRTLERLHAERALSIAVDVPLEHAVRVPLEDLEEMAGNVLDNACTWAGSRVRVMSTPIEDQVLITVDDDGPGLDASMRDAVLQRGVRADESTPGSGLGLAITRDLVELYQGTMTLAASPLGGLRVEILLPEAGNPSHLVI